MASKLAPFAHLAAFEALDAAKRLALAASLAESLGEHFRPLPELLGSKGMVGVEHVPSGVELVAVPGGTFDMGLTQRDVAEIERCIDCGSLEVQRWLQTIATCSSPVRTVVVSPFLLSRRHLEPDQVAAVGGPRTDELSIEAVTTLLDALREFRLPSEAELEYAGRDGGRVSFLHDSGRVWAKTREWPNDSAWGFHAMNDAASAADEWHENYRGAPSSSAPWRAAGSRACTAAVSWSRPGPTTSCSSGSPPAAEGG